MITIKNWTKVFYKYHNYICAIGHDNDMNRHIFMFKLPYYYLLKPCDVPNYLHELSDHTPDRNGYTFDEFSMNTVNNYKRLEYKCTNNQLVEIITYQPLKFDHQVTEYNSDYSNIDMFFILNDIKSLCLVDTSKLPVTPKVNRLHYNNEYLYHINDVELFKKSYMTTTQMKYIYLILDIEVRTINIFPKANNLDNHVSHITFLYSCQNLSYLKKVFNYEGSEIYIDSLNGNPLTLLLSYNHNNPVNTGEFVKKRNNLIGINLEFAREVDLLKYAKWLIEKLEFDIISGYNSNGFDIKYICDRLVYLGEDPLNISVHSDFNSITINPVSTRSKNREVFNIKNGGGKIFFDLYIYMLKNRADLPNYKLNTVIVDYFTSVDCEILERGKISINIKDEDIVENDHPDDVEHDNNDIIDLCDNEQSEITCDYIKVKNTFNRSLINTSDHMYSKTLNIIMKLDDRTNNEFLYLCAPQIPSDIKKISLAYYKTELDIVKAYQDKNTHHKISMYNIQDTNLTYHLLYRCNIDYVFKANVDSTPMTPEEVLMYESSRTSSSLINKYIYDHKYFFVNRGKVSEGKFAAALVLGACNKDRYSPVIVFDFGSLYPNIFIWGNLSYESKAVVMEFNTEIDAQIAKNVLESKLDKNKFICVITRSSKDEPLNCYKLEIFSIDFVGLLPEILKLTLLERDIEKANAKKAKIEGRDHDAILHDYFQINRKLRGNSIYGLMAFMEYTKSDPNLAQACTSIAYDMLQYLVNCFTCKYRVEYTSDMKVVSLRIDCGNIYHPIIDEKIYIPEILFNNTKFFNVNSSEPYYSLNYPNTRVYIYKTYTSIIVSKDIDNENSEKISILTWLNNSELIKHTLELTTLNMCNKYIIKLKEYSKSLGCIPIPPHVEHEPSNVIIEYNVVPVYGDTDSVFLEHITDISEQNSKENLERLWNLGIFEQSLINYVLLFQPLSVKMEKIITHFKNPMKKKYSGCTYESVSAIQNGIKLIKTKGLETRNKCKVHKQLEDECENISVRCYDDNVSMFDTKNIIMDMIIEYLQNRVKNLSDFSGFINSRKYTKSSNPNYIPNQKVEEFNKKSPLNQITEGSRYNYVYLVPHNTPLNTKFSSLHDLEHIVDEFQTTKSGYRLYIETYCNIILKDLSTNHNLEFIPEMKSKIFEIV